MSICKNVKKLLLQKIPNIKETYKVLKKRGIEIGMSICRLPDGRLTFSKKKPHWIEGTFLPECEEGELVGSLHTHPESCIFSDTDYKTSIDAGLDFMCIICEEDGKTKLKCVEFPTDEEKLRTIREEVEELSEYVKEMLEKTEISEEEFKTFEQQSKRLEKKLNPCEEEL